MPRHKAVSPETRIEQEASKLHKAIRKYAMSYDRADELLLGSLNPRTQKWQIKVLNRACEILDDQAVLLAASSNGNGKSHGTFIPDHIIESQAAYYRDVTPELQERWARERNDEVQQRIDQAFARGKYEERREMRSLSLLGRLRVAIKPVL